MKKSFEQMGAKQKDKYLLDIWQRVVKMKAGYRCERCGTPSNLQSHHIYGRTNYNVRYDHMNGCCLCAGHHKLNRDSAHNAPMPFAEFMIEKRGEVWYLDLQKRATKHETKIDKTPFKEELEAKVKEMEL